MDDHAILSIVLNNGRSDNLLSTITPNCSTSQQIITKNWNINELELVICYTPNLSNQMIQIENRRYLVLDQTYWLLFSLLVYGALLSTLDKPIVLKKQSDKIYIGNEKYNYVDCVLSSTRYLGRERILASLIGIKTFKSEKPNERKSNALMFRAYLESAELNLALDQNENEIDQKFYWSLLIAENIVIWHEYCHWLKESNSIEYQEIEYECIELLTAYKGYLFYPDKTPVQRYNDYFYETEDMYLIGDDGEKHLLIDFLESPINSPRLLEEIVCDIYALSAVYDSLKDNDAKYMNTEFNRLFLGSNKDDFMIAKLILSTLSLLCHFDNTVTAFSRGVNGDVKDLKIYNKKLYIDSKVNNEALKKHFKNDKVTLTLSLTDELACVLVILKEEIKDEESVLELLKSNVLTNVETFDWLSMVVTSATQNQSKIRLEGTRLKSEINRIKKTFKRNGLRYSDLNELDILNWK